MERRRKVKLLVILALVISIASLSLGFAAFSASLSISSSAGVSPDSSTFSVKFSSSKDTLVVSEIEPNDISDGITAGNGIIDNTTSPLLTNLTATFTEPGQYVEYTFFARNEGEYTAYLNSINFIGEKSCTLTSAGTMSTHVQSACDSISMKVIVGEEEYTETTEISRHALLKKSGEEIRVRIDYDSTGGWADSPFKVTFSNIMMVYSTIDDSAYIPSDISGGTRLLIDEVKRGAMLDTGIIIKSTKGSGKYLRNGTQNDEYPVYYLRGDAPYMYVAFANLCWKVVRTTETGGIKIIYNSSIDSSGACSASSGIKSVFSEYNHQDVSLADVGYMYGNRVKLSAEDVELYNGTFKYGKDVIWDGNTYRLQNTTTGNFSNVGTAMRKAGYIYTCGNTTGVCTSVKLMYDYYYSIVYTLMLSDGKYLDDVFAETFANTNDSAIKKTLDAWYEAKLVDYTSKLEDTVWCNERKPFYNKANGIFYFNVFSRLWMSNTNILLECIQENDSFTVSPDNGNGALKYPIGLLTVDETFLSNITTPSMTPLYVSDTGDVTINNGPIMAAHNISNAYSALLYKPAISLIHETKIVSGNGTSLSPYVVE